MIRNWSWRGLVPNALTMGNLLGGVLVIHGIGAGWSPMSLVGLWVGALACDLVDGAAARKLGVAGPMGVQLDSLADAVTSGVAPAVVGLVLLTDMDGVGELWWWLPMTVAVAAVWRLARFNVTSENEYGAAGDLGFEGMPAPAAALWWISVLMLVAEGAGETVILAAVILGSTAIPWAMVSRKRMVDVKDWGKNARYDRARKVVLASSLLAGLGVGGGLGLAAGGVLAGVLAYVVGSLLGQSIMRHSPHSA